MELRNVNDLRHVYTPGVARVAQSIQKNPERAWELTGLASSVGIFTNGTRVLGLGNVGTLAALPVMEGKAVLYDQLVGISATPILVSATDPKRFVETVVDVSTSFAAIHLEDIRAPDCFVIEERLQDLLAKPVLHDDQHGTATAVLAAVINAARLTGVDLRRAHVGQIGLGAAGSAIAKLLLAFGVGQLSVFDPSRAAAERIRGSVEHCGSPEEVVAHAEIVVAATGRPGLIRPDMVRPKQVILALSNPDPEIAPSEAIAAGAALAADGRSINNALAFPGLFRGVLDARARRISVEMMLAAAETIAGCAHPNDLVPNPLDRSVHQAVAAAVRDVTERQGLVGTLRAGE